MRLFTLIEILIIGAIITLISNLGLASYNYFSQQLILKSEAYELVTTLELLRKKAISSDKGVGFSCNNFAGYRLNLNSNNYNWGIICNNNYIQIKTKNLPFSIIINNPQQIIFTPLKISFSTTLSIPLKNTSVNKCLIINISQNGIINLNENFQNCP